MASIASAFLVGTLFGFGLAVSEMIDPARVIGFLDVAGRWDPTLLFVMGGALAVTLPGFPLILRRARPLLAEFFALPTKSKLDGSLIVGAIIFGIGWGIAGFCPGPALAALASGSPAVALFVVAMIAGQWAASLLETRP
ncbi:MAG: YeeE/YedE family protein [Deltaproteobacteria bacterium]|nr:YeeE/YedE family protein [Deltaproteobacteria bacterium]MBI2229519.1 YeeE/YedE family protein [Deltaproteobacteria bacterium]MBI2366700.1 YeeE/YedE family protein [Deltaproteobacteria bacterium]MBI2535311.1 YeeE/YedE family protein [Deltaproteobacteria bacterium]MBI3065951.1 YeeE/YedE family protein [Deltaproteobacteria bacterium]